MTDWRTYLQEFHAERPGITESILAQCHDDQGRTPYEWALEAVPDGALVLDVACGSAPLFQRLAGRWVGLDRSRSELELAAARGAGPLVLADGVAPPLRSRRVDGVVCAMGLMLLQPLERALAELARLLRPGGAVVALLPATRPLSLRDRARYVQLLRAVRRWAFRYPNDTALARPRELLAEHRLHLLEDRRERFELSLESEEVAAALVRSLYLPGVTAEQVAAATGVAHRWAGTRLGVPLRRVVARR